MRLPMALKWSGPAFPRFGAQGAHRIGAWGNAKSVRDRLTVVKEEFFKPGCPPGETVEGISARYASRRYGTRQPIQVVEESRLSTFMFLRPPSVPPPGRYGAVPLGVLPFQLSLPACLCMCMAVTGGVGADYLPPGRGMIRVRNLDKLQPAGGGSSTGHLEEANANGQEQMQSS